MKSFCARPGDGARIQPPFEDGVAWQEETAAVGSAIARSMVEAEGVGRMSWVGTPAQLPLSERAL